MKLPHGNTGIFLMDDKLPIFRAAKERFTAKSSALLFRDWESPSPVYCFASRIQDSIWNLSL